MIYYSHVNEDNRAERHAFGTGPYDRLLTVAGSGERVIALLDAPGLKTVDVIDINPEALYLLKIKLAALELLDIGKYLRFIGFYPMTAKDREICFRICKKKLEEEVSSYWKTRSDWQRYGFLQIGHFERFLARTRPLLNFFLGKGFKEAFRNDFSNFPTKRWTWLKALFSRKWIFKLLGNRDEAFTGPACRPDLISKGIQYLLNTKQLNKSFMAHLIFTGHLRDMEPIDLPPSLQLSVLLRVQDILRNHALNIHFYKDDFLNHFERNVASLKAERVFCSLSDLLSFETPDYLHSLLTGVDFEANQNMTFIIRSFLRNELQSTDFQKIKKNNYDIKNLSRFDQTAVYKVHKIGKRHVRV